MGLRIIGAGLGRTGTTSLKLALEELLGGPCYHMLEVRERVEDPDVWGGRVHRTPPDADDNGWTRMGRGMMEGFTPDWQQEAAAKAAFVGYNDRVRATAPNDGLVEWSPGDGWDPICAALGMSVPDQPFPHVNPNEETRALLGLE